VIGEKGGVTPRSEIVGKCMVLEGTLILIRPPHLHDQKVKRKLTATKNIILFIVFHFHIEGGHC